MKVAVFLALLGMSLAGEHTIVVDEGTQTCIGYKKDDPTDAVFKLGVKADDSAKFNVIDMDSGSVLSTMPCPATTIFKLADCACDYDPNASSNTPGGPTPTPRDPTKPFVCSNFNDRDDLKWGYQWEGENVGDNAWAGNPDNNVTLTDDGMEGKGAILNGNGRFELPYFTGNYRTETGGFGVTLAFRRTAGQTGDMYLVSNAACYYRFALGTYPHASVEVISHDDETVSVRATTLDLDTPMEPFDLFPPVKDSQVLTIPNVADGVYHELVFSVLSADGVNGAKTLTVKVDDAVAEVDIEAGPLYPHWCPLEFGDRFKGEMDNICIYKRDVPDAPTKRRK